MCPHGIRVDAESWWLFLHPLCARSHLLASSSAAGLSGRLSLCPSEKLLGVLLLFCRGAGRAVERKQVQPRWYAISSRSWGWGSGQEISPPLQSLWRPQGNIVRIFSSLPAFLSGEDGGQGPACSHQSPPVPSLQSNRPHALEGPIRFQLPQPQFTSPISAHPPRTPGRPKPSSEHRFVLGIHPDQSSISSWKMLRLCSSTGCSRAGVGEACDGWWPQFLLG